MWKADAAWMMETMLATLAQGLAADDQQKCAPRFRRATKEEAEAKLNLVWGHWRSPFERSSTNDLRVSTSVTNFGVEAHR